MQNETHKYTRYWIWTGYLLVTLLVVLNAQNFFYWDTVQLGAKHANFFFDTNFSRLLLPDGIDSGHIPAFGIYLALIWKLFGKTLLVSHLAMLPFALGIVYQLHRLCVQFIDTKFIGPALILVLIDPTLLSQLVLVSPDVPLVLFFLMAVNATLHNKQWILSLSVLLLFLVSMRGMMLSVCVLLLDLYCNVSIKRKLKELIPGLLRRSIVYLPALAIFLAFSAYHFAQKGWIGFHSDSPWAGSFEAVDLKGFLYNIGILGWRILDFGRVGVWLVVAIIMSLSGRSIFKDKKTRLLLYFSVTLLVLLPLNLVWAKGLLAHRYLLPIFLMISLLCVRMLFSEHVLSKNKEPLAYLLFFILISGNFWIYPAKVAQGWDSTLAHLPYYELRKEGMSFLDEAQIDFREVASFFPNTADISEIDLSTDTGNFKEFDGTQQYVFYSNSYNLSDEEFRMLETSFTELRRFENRGIVVVVYQKNSMP
jgi:hypothetical protein